MPMWNTGNFLRACRACLAGFVLVILSASLADAVYGPRTTIGANYQQTSNTTSTDGINPVNCFNVAACYTLFQVAPQQKRLIVQHVSCRMNKGGDLQYVFLGSRKGQDFLQKRSVLLPVPTTGAWWAVSSPVMHLLESRERPFVRFVNSEAGNWFTECTISGQLM